MKPIYNFVGIDFIIFPALDASEKGSIEVCGHKMTMRLKNLSWRQTLDKELELCSGIYFARVFFIKKEMCNYK